jgi:glucose/arabinose dehydrogenase
MPGLPKYPRLRSPAPDRTTDDARVVAQLAPDPVTARDGMDQPLVHWTPSISPSGLTIYSGCRFPAWRGNVFLGALSARHLRRLELLNGRVAHEEELLARLHQRIRDVRQGPDGLLYVLTDAGALLGLEPAP